jgi:hypothetical protein
MNSSELSDRYIPLATGAQGLRGTLQVKIQEPSALDSGPSTPVLEFVASDETLDRYNEIISASGWNLDNYQRNPVFQNNHQTGDIIHTLGKALVTEVRGGQLLQRVQFATDVNPMARIAYGLYKGGFLNAVSVGFVPLRWVTPDGKEYSVHGKSAAEISLSAGGEVAAFSSSGLQSQIENQKSKIENPRTYRRKFLEQELLEVSAVGIPANPNALALGLKSGAVEKSDLGQTIDLFRLTLEGSATRGVDSLSATGRGTKGEVAVSDLTRRAHLTAFVRQLHTILRS